MWMTRVAIKNPVFCAMVMFALMVMGIVSYMRLPIDAMPDVQVPIGVVFVSYPGASPQAVENDLTKPIENTLNPISGVKKIRSRSREGSSLVIVEFDMNIKMDVAIQDMRDKLAQIRPGFPKEAKDPYISKANNDDDRAVVSLGVTSKTRSPGDVAYLVEEIIRKRLENVTGVATIETIGAASREVRVEVDPAKLRARRIGVDQVIAALRNDNIDVPVGTITSGINDKSVRIDARFKSISDFENLVIARRDGVQVRVSDIGTVIDGVREQNSFARIDGTKAVILDMKKVRGSNTVEVGEGVKKAIERVKKELPLDIELSILSDQSRYVKASVKNVHRRRDSHSDDRVLVPRVMAFDGDYCAHVADLSDRDLYRALRIRFHDQCAHLDGAVAMYRIVDRRRHCGARKHRAPFAHGQVTRSSLARSD
jgi:hydrophobic/amphiphilic exporter-1 (mainly G- bacteria), HAE1 family